MVRKNSSLLLAAIATLLSIVSIAWFSCSKSNGLVKCEGVICENGASCGIDTVTKKPRCFCPVGYEGSSCATASIGKYLGTWLMRQVVFGSDSSASINDTSYYTVFLVKSATPTTFFMNNFANNPYYNQIICTLDSTSSFHFYIDTISAYHMLFDNYKVTFGDGYVTVNDSAIFGSFGVRHLTSTANYVNDTIIFSMTQYH